MHAYLIITLTPLHHTDHLNLYHLSVWIKWILRIILFIIKYIINCNTYLYWIVSRIICPGHPSPKPLPHCHNKHPRALPSADKSLIHWISSATFLSLRLTQSPLKNPKLVPLYLLFWSLGISHMTLLNFWPPIPHWSTPTSKICH